MSHMKFRLLVASLLCVSIHGCASTGVGTPLPSGGLTKFLLYAPEDSQLALEIYNVTNGIPLQFARDSAYDSSPHRPSGTPTDYVAFTAKITLDSGTYDSDLMSWSTPMNDWVFVDTVDLFSPNELVVISKD